MLKKISFCVIVIILIIAGMFVAKSISKNNETTETIANSTNIVKEPEEKISIENEIVNNIGREEETNNVKEEQTTKELTFNTPEEKAKQIVENNWGEDDSVYYSYDGKDENGNYIICVRDKNSTKALYFYYVNIESESFDVK